MSLRIVTIVTFLFLVISCAHSKEESVNRGKQEEPVGKIDVDGWISQIQRGDYESVESFLDENEAEFEQHPDYYVILLNYAISKGDKSKVVIENGESNDGDFALADKNTGDTVGYMAVEVEYDEALIANSLARTQAALRFFETRLDIHFGIVVIATKIERWDIVGDQLEKIIESSVRIQNKWDWGSINSMEGDPEEFMLENIQSNLNTLFKENTPEADETIVSVSKALIKHYPNCIYGYANLGTLYTLKKKYDLAKQYFLRALEIDPKDDIVLSNLKKLEELLSP